MQCPVVATRHTDIGYNLTILKFLKFRQKKGRLNCADLPYRYLPKFPISHHAGFAPSVRVAPALLRRVSRSAALPIEQD